mgnify:CR=1 FL=1
MECPYCGNTNISHWSVSHQDEVYTHYKCNECGTEWES